MSGLEIFTASFSTLVTLQGYEGKYRVPSRSCRSDVDRISALAREKLAACLDGASCLGDEVTIIPLARIFEPKERYTLADVLPSKRSR